MKAVRGGLETWFGAVSIAVALVCGCSDPSAPSGPNGGSADGGAGGGEGVGGAPDEPSGGPSDPPGDQHVAVFDFFNPQSLQPGGEGGGGGGDSGPPGPPYGTSTECGDAIVGSDEECDDGDGGAPTGPDACTDECQTRDEAGGPGPTMAEPATDRYLGAGRHPVSGLDEGFITTYVQAGGDEAAIGATLFNIWGQPAHYLTVSEGASPIYEANPVAAALPDGRYAVAWSDFDSDGSDLGVALREVKAGGSLGSLRSANAGKEFTQQDPDILWTGDELVVAWVDYANAATGPDIRYRTFAEDLSPTSDDVPLAQSALPEAAVAIAYFQTGWAAAYREGLADGRENVVVRVGEATFRSAPMLGGPIDDRLALVELDETHLLVVYSEGTDPSTTGTYNVPRIRYAVVDIEGAATFTSHSLQPLDDVFTADNLASHHSPSASEGPDGVVYVGWSSEAQPGDAAGDQIWLKVVSWDPARETELDLTEPEVLIPRVCDGSRGDQRRPAIAPVLLPPEGALALAWDDYSRGATTTLGEPDVVVHYAPLHARPAGQPSLVTEDWLGANNAAWPAQWTHIITTSGALPVNIQQNEARIWSNGGSGTAISYINDHKALDVEMFTKVRWNLNSARAGFVARLNETTPPTYLAARVGTLINDTWLIFAVIPNGMGGTQQITIDTGPSLGAGTIAALFTSWAQELEFFMRFRVSSNADNTFHVGMKLWLSDVAEPSDWTMDGTVSDMAIINALGSTPGRFGLLANNQQSQRMTYFDDFHATFHEGAVEGDPTVVPVTSPLMREKPLYPTCLSGQPCCCFDDDDCGEGLSCQSEQNELLGLGSHAKTCSAEHCDNLRRDADETRVNCGGEDCAPCECTLTAALGSANYCDTTCLCGIGEGSCSNNYECLPGLACKGGGYKFGLTPTITVCEPHHCFNRALDEYPTVAVSETAPDCGGECGDCYSDPTNGTFLHCRVWAKCPNGHGRCQFHDDCQSGFICGGTGQGVKWGLPAGTPVCVIPHCDNNIFQPQAPFFETSTDCGGPDCGPCPP